MKKTIQNISTILTNNHLTLSVAESLTGGALSASLVSIPKATSYFKGGIIAYDNTIKTSLLNVSVNTLQTKGAVSYECAEEMALGVKKLFSTDISISLTGIAGPSGGTSLKPVGLVFAGFIIQNRIIIKEYYFKGLRSQIIKKTVETILKDALIIIQESVDIKSNLH